MGDELPGVYYAITSKKVAKSRKYTVVPIGFDINFWGCVVEGVLEAQRGKGTESDSNKEEKAFYCAGLSESTLAPLPLKRRYPTASRRSRPE